MQSKEWEEFQKSLGRKVFRIDGALITKLPLVFGENYFYCCGYLKFNFKQLGDLAKKESAVFLKLEPMTDDKSFAQELLKSDFRESKKEIQPQRTIILDITKFEDELLQAMQQKTRYNIRLAVKQGVKVINSNDEIDKFWGLMQKTTQRDKFGSHTKEYYEKLTPFTKLFIAQYNGRTTAANIVLFHGDTAYYLHGASDYEYRSFMAPYLLHWETIRYAKEHGYKKYDFWGIDEVKWPGVTRFKRGFGGREVKYIGSYDYVFQPLWYKLYNLRNKLKSLR